VEAHLIPPLHATASRSEVHCEYIRNDLFVLAMAILAFMPVLYCFGFGASMQAMTGKQELIVCLQWLT
jgi:hypothetical protein